MKTKPLFTAILTLSSVLCLASASKHGKFITWLPYDKDTAPTISTPSISFPHSTGTTFVVTIADWDMWYYISGGNTYYQRAKGATGTIDWPLVPFTGVDLDAGGASLGDVTFTIQDNRGVSTGVTFSFDITFTDTGPWQVLDSPVTKTEWATIT